MIGIIISAKHSEEVYLDYDAKIIVKDLIFFMLLGCKLTSFSEPSMLDSAILRELEISRGPREASHWLIPTLKFTYISFA